MAGGCLRTVFRDGFWLNLIEGQRRPASQHAFQTEAVARGRQLARARGLEHVVESRDGRVVERVDRRPDWSPVA